MNRFISVRVGTRILLIVAWVAAIFGFLYSPYLAHYIGLQRSINIFAWTEMIDAHQIAEFQKQTGIKVNIGYYESNEELYAKLKVTRGRGYDLIITTDYMVEQFVEQGFLQKLDHTKLDFMHRISPYLLHHYYDPKNEYAIPYLWSVYGIGIDKDYFANKTIEDSWSMIFDSSFTTARRVLIEDPREMILLTAYYLFGSIENIDTEKLHKIKNLLLDQKQFVIAYTDVGAPYLLSSRQSPLALATSPYVLRVAAHHPYIDFVIPKEGTFVILENIVIPAGSIKQDLVYQFVNFIYKKENLAENVSKTYFMGPTVDVPFAETNVSSKALLVSPSSLFKSAEFFRNIISEEAVNALWLALKAY